MIVEAVLDGILANSPAPPNLRQPLEELTIATQNARFSNNPPILVSPPAAYTCVVPAAALDAPSLDVKMVQAVRRLIAPLDDHGGQTGQDHTQWWAHGPTQRLVGKPNPEALWSSRLLRAGIVEHVFNIGQPYPGDRETLVNGFTVEKEIVIRADRSLEMLQALGLHGPTLISVSLNNLDGVHLTGDPHAGPFKTPSLRLRAALVPELGLRAGSLLHEMFDQLWLAAGGRDGSRSFASSDEWAGYTPHSAY